MTFFFFSSRRRHTRLQGDWSSDVCSSDLVAQLLDLSRLDANAIRLEQRRIRVRKRIEEIVRAVAGETDAIEIDVDPELETVVDPGAFDRIVSNLVTNAIRYGAAPI